MLVSFVAWMDKKTNVDVIYTSNSTPTTRGRGDCNGPRRQDSCVAFLRKSSRILPICMGVDMVDRLIDLFYSNQVKTTSGSIVFIFLAFALDYC